MGGVSETSIKYQLYFWILKSYQHGTSIGGERGSRPKHIADWTKNAAEKICIRLRSSVCMRLRQRASACVCAQKIKRPDAKKLLRPDASFVQGLSGCTIYMLHVSCTVQVQAKLCWVNCRIHTQLKHVSHLFKAARVLRQGGIYKWSVLANGVRSATLVEVCVMRQFKSSMVTRAFLRRSECL